MDAVEPYRSSHEALREAPDVPAFVADLRRRGFERFGELGFPTNRLEAWKFTSVSPIARTRFRLASGEEPGEGLLEELRIADGAFVLRNGRPLANRPSSARPGLRIESLEDAWARDPEWVERHLGTLADFADEAFTALNAAFLRAGVVVRVEAGCSIEEPIRIVHAAVPGDDPLMVHSRVVVVLEEGSRATVVEEWVGRHGSVHWTNSVIEIVVGPSASLDHVTIQAEGEDAFHVARVVCRVDRDARYHSAAFSLGAALSRQDLEIALAAPGAETSLDGLYLGRGAQHVDHHTTVDHRAPHGSSRELYKGILAGKARAVFNGRVLVEPDAQKTDAGQVNRNLILSDHALVNTKPELQIRADDVRCSHGATIGRLDEEAVFYLRSRGIEAGDARRILVEAFAGEMVDRVPESSLRAELEGRISEWLREVES